MPNTKSPQNLLKDLKKINDDAREYLAGVDKKIAELDAEYAKMLVKDDISLLKAAKKIVEKRNK
jgi:hypothetical protein